MYRFVAGVTCAGASFTFSCPLSQVRPASLHIIMAAAADTKSVASSKEKLDAERKHIKLPLVQPPPLGYFHQLFC